MALAKFLEDNQERLYASLEESRRQVGAMDEQSSKEDWMFVKNRLTTELKLVQEQFDTVLKIVTNPEFEHYVCDYEQKQSLETKLKDSYTKIDQLLDDQKTLEAELTNFKEKFKKLRGVLYNKCLEIEQNEKRISELNDLITDTKSKLAHAKNDLNHYKTVFYNRMVDYENIHAELVQTKEKLKSIERFIQLDANRRETINEKVSLVSNLTRALVQLDEWCGMLEEELGIEGERPIDIVVDSPPTSSKSRPIKFTTYKSLALELADKSIELTEKTELLHEKDSLIADKDKEIAELRQAVERSGIYQSSLEKEVKKLDEQIEESKKNPNTDDGHKVVRHIKKSDVDKIYNKNKKTDHRRNDRPNKKVKKNSPRNSKKIQSWSADSNKKTKANKSTKKSS